jgi:hypothetical protein
MKQHLKTIPDFSLYHTRYFSKNTGFSLTLCVAGCYITAIIPDFVPNIPHFLKKSSSHLHCAGLHPHVPAAYVGRPARPDDLDERFYDEEACRMVGKISASDQLIFSPNSQRTCEDGHACQWEAPCRCMPSNSRGSIRVC